MTTEAPVSSGQRQTCSERVYDRFSPYAAFHCARFAVVERNGRWYCTQHDPEYVKARQEKREKKINQQREANRLIGEREEREAAHAALCMRACEGLTDEELRRGVVPKMSDEWVEITDRTEHCQRGDSMKTEFSKLKFIPRGLPSRRIWICVRKASEQEIGWITAEPERGYQYQTCDSQSFDGVELADIQRFMRALNRSAERKQGNGRK